MSTTLSRRRLIRWATRMAGVVGRGMGIAGSPRMQRWYAAAQMLLLPDRDVDIDLDFGRMRIPNPRRNIIARMLYLYQAWEPDVARVIRANLGAGMTVVDVGANIGYFTLLMNHAVGASGTVIAFEPQREVRNFLEASIAIHQAAGVKVCPVALFSHRGMGTLVSQDNLNASLARGETAVSEEPVRLYPYDDFPMPWLKKAVDLIKMDVEGAEMDILLGMRRMLRRDRPRLVIEIHPGKLGAFGRTQGELMDLLAASGYSVQPIWDPGNTVTVLCTPVAEKPTRTAARARPSGPALREKTGQAAPRTGGKRR